MSERQDFVSMRDGEYARARSECPPEVIIDREPDREPNGVCKCCGEWKYITLNWHICGECRDL